MALKRLVTSAVTLAMLGCSGSSPESAVDGVPPYTGSLPATPGSVPVDPGGPQQPVPTDTTPDPSSEAGTNTTSPPGQSPSEGQNPDIVGIGGTEEPPASNGGESSGENAGGETQTPTPPTEVEEPPAEEPVPEEPPPIVRPALSCGAPAPALPGGTQGCDVNDSGSVSGLSWFLWYSGGSGCMTAHDNLSGSFTANWNNPQDFLARIGFWFDETQTFDQIGEIGADLSFTKQGSAGGFSFIGLYGWTVNPLVEYYIVEDSYGNGPALPFNTQMRGSFNMDGAQYNIYTGNRINQPSINGNADFVQVLSVRQTPRQCGHVSVSEHFRRWESMGVDLGLAKETKILVEAGGGNGSITFNHAVVTVTPPE